MCTVWNCSAFENSFGLMTHLYFLVSLPGTLSSLTDRYVAPLFLFKKRLSKVEFPLRIQMESKNTGHGGEFHMGIQ